MTENEKKEESLFTCELCNYNTSSKYNYERHILTAKHKMMTNNDGKGAKGAKTSKPFSCEDCGKCYKYRQGLNLHKKKCQGSIIIKNLLEEKEETKKEMDEMRSQIALLMEKSSAITNSNNTNNNNTNNITNNNYITAYITVNNFGNENIEYLTDKTVCRLISSAPHRCIPSIIEKIHFDPEHPENHNVKMTNKKLKYAEVLKNNEWVTTSREKAMNEMIQNGYNIAAQKYSDNKDKIKGSKQGQFENFQVKFGDQDEGVVKTLKSDMDLTLINGTNKIYKKEKEQLKN